MTYSLPENLILKVCAYFDRELNAQDYIPEGEQKDRLFAQADKEYYYKSRLLGLTQQGIVEGGCCPMHVNEGLLPVMKTIREYYHIGKGNVGFGSVFYSKNPCVEDLNTVRLQKEIGGFAVLADRYSSPAYVGELCRQQIIPLIVKDSSAFSKDSFILLKDIRKHVDNISRPEAFVVSVGENLTPIDCQFPELTDEQRKNLLSEEVVE